MTRGKVTKFRYVDLTEDHKTLIVDLYCKGVSVLRLNTEYNVNGDVTRKVLVERGIEIRGRVTGEHTEVSRALLAEQQTGRRYSEESKKKMSDSHIGKLLPEEQRKKISESLMGIKRKPEAIEKTRQAHIGSKWSEETRAKINRDKSPEQRQKISDSLM